MKRLRFFCLVFLFCLVTSNALANDVADLTYTGDSFSIAGGGLTITFAHDGLRMYRSADFGSLTFYQYTLSSAWDITTAVAAGSKNLSTNGITGAYFNSDGTKMYINHFYSDVVYQYSLSTPWDITTATYDSVSKSWTTGNHYTMAMRQDGTSIYEVNSWADYVKQHNLSTAWNLSTAGAAVATLSTPSSIGYYKTGAHFSSDGSKLYLLTTDSSSANSKIKQYNLSTPWNVGTGVLSANEFSLTSQSASMRGLYVSSDNQYLFALGQSTGAQKVFKYRFNSADITSPTVSLTSPTASENASSSVTLTATASDGVGVAGVKFYIDNALIGSEDVSSPYSLSWDSTSASDGNHTAFAVARDAANNYATSSSVTFSVDNTDPAISNIASSTTSSTATITWNTDEVASSLVNFGLTTSYGTSTSEINTLSRVTSHSISIVNLKACASYYFQIQSKDSVLNTATSTEKTFTTIGCKNNASVSGTGQSSVTVSSGGTLTHGKLTLSTPASFTATSSTVTFQSNLLDGTTFFDGTTLPNGKNKAGNTVFHLLAFTDATTTLSTFSSPLQVTLSYTAEDIVGIEESTLKIHRYDGTDWYELSNCSVNTSAKTVTCDTNAFSDFALFGDAVVVSENNSVSSSVSSGNTIQSRVANLIAMGNIVEANKLKQEWPHLFMQNSEMIQDIVLKNSSTITATTAQMFDISNISSSTLSMSTLPVLVKIIPTDFTGKFERNLDKDDEGEDVKMLQKYLIKQNAGPSAKELARVGATGYFGNYTKNALGEFQKFVGIEPWAGFFGPITREYVQSKMK